MTKRRKIEVDNEMNALIQKALDAGISLTTISNRANVHHVTLWRWRNGKSSPITNERNAVMEAVRSLIQEKLL